VLQSLVTANSASNSLILFTLMVEAIHSSETSVLTKESRCRITEDILHHHSVVLIPDNDAVYFVFQFGVPSTDGTVTLIVHE
jgi:hypothetical protein